MLNLNIPFNKPFLVGKELFYIAQSVLSGHIAGDGLFTRKCHELMQKKFLASKILLTHSCTAALEMAATLGDIKPGDEVILPSFTFVSTANAFYGRGAKLVFIDIRPDTLNIDETKIKEKVTERTKAIVPVHYAGVACEMDDIMDVAKENNLLVIEDAAHGVNSKYKDKYLGTIGDIGAFSFHETKNFICGEGGAIVINNEKFVERAEIIREKGTNRTKFFRGEIDEYTWVDQGSSYLPSDLLAAFLYAQLENMDQINTRRANLYDYYYKALIPLVKNGKLKLPFVSDECDSNNHLFYIILNDENTRNGLMNFLQARGVLAVFHYLPLHLSPVGKSMGYVDGQFPVTESMSKCLLRLPFFYDLKKKEIDSIIQCIADYFY